MSGWPPSGAQLIYIEISGLGPPRKIYATQPTQVQSLTCPHERSGVEESLTCIWPGFSTELARSSRTRKPDLRRLLSATHCRRANAFLNFRKHRLMNHTHIHLNSKVNPFFTNSASVIARQMRNCHTISRRDVAGGLTSSIRRRPQPQPTRTLADSSPTSRRGPRPRAPAPSTDRTAPGRPRRRP